MTETAMRITLVTETYPPEINGVAITLGRAVEALRARGHDVTLIRPRQAEESPSPGLMFALPLFFYRQVRLGCATPSTLQRWLRDWGSEIVHVATEGPLGLAALIAARRLHIPAVTSFHTNFDQYAAHYGLPLLGHGARIYLRAFHNAGKLTLVPSQSTLDRLQAQGFQQLRRWGRGVDTVRFHPQWRDDSLRESLGLGPEGRLLLYVGRLAPEKNLTPLITGFRALRRSCRTTVLVLVGDGPLRPEFSRLSHEGILCVGMQQGMDLARWYASADLFCFPSCSETFGNVVLEAEASGLPILAYDCPGVNEQVDDVVHGLLLPPGSDWTAMLQLLCKDSGLRHTFGAAGRLRAESQSWTLSFDMLEAAYREQLWPKFSPP
ncbi:MAG: glycosyltransferase family 4 protein [Acidithiobacillus ferriphilus]